MVSKTMMQSSVIHYIYELMCYIIYIDQSFKRKSGARVLGHFCFYSVFIGWLSIIDFLGN